MDSSTLDDQIVAAIKKRFKALATERDDWRYPHVSDVYGCDYSTHARRSADKKPQENRTPESCVKIQIGVDVERYVAEGLSLFCGATEIDGTTLELERGERIAWNPVTGEVRRGLLEAGHVIGEANVLGDGTVEVWRCKHCSHCSPEEGELIGHVDVTIDGISAVLEIKSTQFYRGKAPTEPAAWYIEQTASYAVAMGYKRAGVLIVDRNTGELAGPFWLELDSPPPAIEGVYDPTKGTLREQTIARAREVLERTDPEAFPPDPKPRYKWQPSYCRLGEACACK